jgi:hypothetical protein
MSTETKTRPLVDCPCCDGRGETGHLNPSRNPAAPPWLTEDCGTCHAQGLITAECSEDLEHTECGKCGETLYCKSCLSEDEYELEEWCSHNDTIWCQTCALRLCDECILNAADDAVRDSRPERGEF